MERKKHFWELKQVRTFMRSMPGRVNAEYGAIVERLELEGRLVSPFGEKVEPGLFAIRVIKAGNVRVFYAYGKDDKIYGLHAYEKKSERIPMNELEQARRMIDSLERMGLI